MQKTIYYSIIFIFSILLTSCGPEAIENQAEDYEGPILELTDIETLYSDSAVVRLKLKAPRRLEFLNKDSEYPQGIYLEFYEADGSMSATLQSNYCYHYSTENKYRVLGNVILKSFEDEDQLNTEELFWDPIKEIVYTDKFVRVETEGRILMGEGLEAKQDFSYT